MFVVSCFCFNFASRKQVITTRIKKKIRNQHKLNTISNNFKKAKDYECS